MGIRGSQAVEAALRAHREFIMTETLAAEWVEGEFDANFTTERKLESDSWEIALARQNA